jgi:hypothetical protein
LLLTLTYSCSFVSIIRYVALESRQQALEGIAVAQAQVIRGVPIQARLQSDSPPAHVQRDSMQPIHNTPHSLPTNFSPTLQYSSHAPASRDNNYVSGRSSHVQAPPFRQKQRPIPASNPMYHNQQEHVFRGVPSGIYQQDSAQPIDYSLDYHQVYHPYPTLFVPVDEANYQCSMESSFDYNANNTRTDHYDNCIGSENYNHQWNMCHDERSIQGGASNADNPVKSKRKKKSHAQVKRYQIKMAKLKQQQIAQEIAEIPFLSGDQGHFTNEMLASSATLYADVVGKPVETKAGDAAKALSSSKTDLKDKNVMDAVVQGLSKLSVFEDKCWIINHVCIHICFE